MPKVSLLLTERKGETVNKLLTSAFLLSVVLICSCGDLMAETVWDVNNVESIGGRETTVLGSPKIIETEKGKAVEFDGVKDGFIVNALPLAGAEKFTVEVIFRPDPNGLEAQRFLHMQENNSNNRLLILLETLPTDQSLWYLDTYIRSAKGSQNLYKPACPHPMGQWYNATLVYNGKEMQHYVNGAKEISKKLVFSPLSRKGKTSIGVKIGRKSWFKGVIRKVRFTRRVLKPEEFLQP